MRKWLHIAELVGRFIWYWRWAVWVYTTGVFEHEAWIMQREVDTMELLGQKIARS